MKCCTRLARALKVSHCRHQKFENIFSILYHLIWSLRCQKCIFSQSETQDLRPLIFRVLRRSMPPDPFSFAARKFFTQLTYPPDKMFCYISVHGRRLRNKSSSILQRFNMSIAKVFCFVPSANR